MSTLTAAFLVGCISAKAYQSVHDRHLSRRKHTPHKGGVSVDAAAEVVVVVAPTTTWTPNETNAANVRNLIFTSSPKIRTDKNTKNKKKMKGGNGDQKTMCWIPGDVSCLFNFALPGRKSPSGASFLSADEARGVRPSHPSPQRLPVSTKIGPGWFQYVGREQGLIKAIACSSKSLVRQASSVGGKGGGIGPSAILCRKSQFRPVLSMQLPVSRLYAP